MSSPARPSPETLNTGHHTEHLLNEHTGQRYRSLVHEGVDRLTSKITSVTGPVPGATVADLHPRVAAIDLDAPLTDPSAVFDELDDVYLRDAVYFHHPRYLGHLNCPVVIPAVVAESFLATINSSMDTWDQSMGATLIERRLIGWTTDRIGLGPDADGVFTSGGTQSNLQALLIARDEARARARDAGEMHDPLPRLRIFTSACSHFSISKSATLLGLSPDSVVAIPTDEQRRMRADVLETELQRCADDGLIVMAVVGTAGTTDFGSIDPLERIATLCARHHTWFHVDAAYGCGLLISRQRPLLHGIEHADSVTVDYHKSFFQPVSSSAVLLRDRASLRHVTYHADYLNPADNNDLHKPNQVDKSLQTTRRFDALKLWMTLRMMGPAKLGALFDDVLERAQQAWELLRTDARYQIVVAPQLSTLVFRYVPTADLPEEVVDAANIAARDALFASGEAVVSGTSVDGRWFLKFTLLNPETTVHDIATVLDLLAEHAENHLAEHLRPEYAGSRAS